MPRPPLDRDHLAFACFASPLDAVRRDGLQVLGARGRLSQADRLELPAQPYSSGGAKRTTLWAPDLTPENTAFMAHFSDGWATLVHTLATRFGHAGAAVRMSPTNATQWPIFELIVYRDGCERRLVRAMRDDPRWEFLQHGAALEFEEPLAYSRRRVRDRFTREMLARYLSALGWDMLDERFWSTSVSTCLLTLLAKT